MSALHFPYSLFSYYSFLDDFYSSLYLFLYYSLSEFISFSWFLKVFLIKFVFCYFVAYEVQFVERSNERWNWDRKTAIYWWFYFISLTRFDLTDVNIEYQLRLSTQYRAIGAFYIPTPLVADFEDFKIKLHSSLKTSVDYGSTHVLERNSFQWWYLTFTIHWGKICMFLNRQCG